MTNVGKMRLQIIFGVLHYHDTKRPSCKFIDYTPLQIADKLLRDIFLKKIIYFIEIISLIKAKVYKEGYRLPDCELELLA